MRWLLGTALAGIAAAFGMGFIGQDPTHELLKTRTLLVVDEKGTPRVILGAPVDDKKWMGFERNKPMYGLAICDANANEQIGMGVSDDGSVGLGLDAKVGVGNPGNRERINLAVRPDGSSMIRMLDNDTFLKSLWSTSKEGKSSLLFMKWATKDGKSSPEGGMTYGTESRFQSAEELFRGG